MLNLAQMDAAKQQALVHYPKESRYVRWGMGASILAHLLFATIVLILAWLNNIHNLRDLMASQIAMSPPDQVVPVILIEDDTPPPPTDHPEWIRQLIQQPKVPPPPKPKPKPKPQPKPQPIIQHQVHGAVGPANQTITVGSGNFPKPPYTYKELVGHMSGTVLIHLQFDGSGGVTSCEVIKSSGYTMLDSSTTSFILERWHDSAWANKNVSVPIIYRPGGG